MFFPLRERQVPPAPSRATGFKVVPAQRRKRTGQQGSRGVESQSLRARGWQPRCSSFLFGGLSLISTVHFSWPVAPASPWLFSSQILPGLGGQGGAGHSQGCPRPDQVWVWKPQVVWGHLYPETHRLLGIPRTRFPGAPLPDFLAPLRTFMGRVES